MDKRTILAFLLIALIFILTPYYYKLVSPPAEPSTTTTEADETGPETPTNPSPASLSPDTSAQLDRRQTFSFPVARDEETLIVETNLYVATVSSLAGGSLTSFSLKKFATYTGGPVNLINPRMQGENLLISFRSLDGDSVILNQNFDLVETLPLRDTLFATVDDLSLTFQSHVGALKVTKRIIFHPDSYLIDILIDLSNISRQLVSEEQFALRWDGGLPTTEKSVRDDVRYFSAHLFQGGELLTHKATKDHATRAKGQTEWVAIRSKYFTAALIPKSKSWFGFMNSTPASSPPGLSMGLGFSSNQPVKCSLYLGPLKYKEIKELNVGLEKTMNLGLSLIRPISLGVLALLTSMHKLVPNYGVLLIIFAVLVKILLYPLTKKSYRSTKEMQAIQPRIIELREKYKGDPKRLNQATMKIYKDHGVNPLGGCLPTLLQMPLLFALFIVFRTTIELRGAPFVWWIKDLSAPDAIVQLPFTIPIYGDQVCVLPILMGISMFAQQKLMGTQTSGQQRFMSYFMTGFFFLIFNTFPSGLNLYYTLFNVLTVLQQKYFIPVQPRREPISSNP